ncbi:MAG: hypothetical protein FJ150_10475 [Euryarchaeota archaeon]|nr:hypothetical protein [Euryarchaeota archaeon]
MCDNGWWFILSLPDDFFHVELQGLEDRITPKLLTKKIVEYFNKDECKELEDILNSWELESFSNNKKIFQDALWAHKESKYTLTVPTLTIQVEGVIRSYLDYISEHSIHPYKEALKKRYEESISENRGLESFIQKKNLEFLEKKLENFYQSFEPSKPKNFDDLYRHPLFHGQYLNYHSIEISTKLFLFLDMLYWILDDLEKYNKKDL